MRNRALTVLALVLGVAASASGAEEKARVNTIKKVSVKGGTVEIVGTQKPSFTTFPMNDPPRFVIDISEAVFSGVPEDVTVPGGGRITAIKTATYGNDASAIARVVIGFDRDVEPDVQASGNTLVVKVGAGSPPAVASRTAPAATPVATGSLDKSAVDQVRAAADKAVPTKVDRSAEEQAAREALAKAQAAKAAEAEKARAAALAEQERQAELARQREAIAAAEAQRREKEKAEREARARAEQERIAQDKARAEAQVRAEADRKAQEEAVRTAEAQRRAQDAAAAAAVAQAESSRKAQEEAARAAAARAEADRKAQEEATRVAAAKVAADRKAQEEAAARAEAQRKAQEETARAEAQRKAQDDATRAEAQRRAQDAAAAAAVAQAESSRKAQEDAARAEAQRRAQEDAARAASARAEAERRAQEEARRAEEERRAAEATASRKSMVAAAEPQRTAASAASDARAADAAPARPSAPPSSGGTEVSARRKTVMLVGFVSDKSRVFVRTNEPVRYTISQVDERTVVLELENTAIHRRNDRRPLDTRFFSGPVVQIAPRPASGKTVRVAVTLRDKVGYQARQDGNEVSLQFAP